MTIPSRPEKPVTTVETALEILEFVKRCQGATLTEITDSTEFAKSTVLRHLVTLEYSGLLARKGDEYRLGLRFLDYGIHVRDTNALYQVGRERANQLAEETDGKVWLTAVQHGQSVHLHEATGSYQLSTDVRVGQRRYLHQFATGKAILASLSDSEVEEVLTHHGLPARTRHTITNRDDLFDELKEIRERGYAFNREESTKGLHAVGASISGPDDKPIGGLSVSGPANTMRGEYFEQELPEILLGATNQIEVNLRYS